MKAITYLFCWFVLGSAVAVAQDGSSVSGKVTNSVTGEPIPYATVFFANTMFGTRSDPEGKYILKEIPNGKYDLTVSSVGYQMERIVISVTAAMTDINVALKPEVKVLKDVVVTTSKSEYARELKLFKQYFIGQTKNAEKCTIKNEDDIQLWRDEISNVFRATCDKPIEVENRALGYMVYYTLQEFVMNFDSHVFTMRGAPRFEALFPANKHEDYKFLKERDRAYYGSLNHFMRSLREGKLARNRFDLYIWRKGIKRSLKTGVVRVIPQSKYAFYPINPYGMSQIRKDSLLRLLIRFKGAVQEYNYNKAEFKYGYPQTSYLTYLRSPLVIHENGVFDNPMDFFLEGYWGWRENVVAELLPIEYRPILSLKDQKMMDKLEEMDSINTIKQLEIEERE